MYNIFNQTSFDFNLGSDQIVSIQLKICQDFSKDMLNVQDVYLESSHYDRSCEEIENFTRLKLMFEGSIGRESSCRNVEIVNRR